MPMKNLPYPGAFVRCYCREPLDHGVTGAACRLGISRRQFLFFANCREGTSRDGDLTRQGVCGLQMAHELVHAMKKRDRIRAERLVPVE